MKRRARRLGRLCVIGCRLEYPSPSATGVFSNSLLQLPFTLPEPPSTTLFKMTAKFDRSHKHLAEKLGNCIQHIKSTGFRSFPDFMRQLFVEFPKGQRGPAGGPYQTVVQTLRSFLVWDSLKPVLDGIATSEMMGEDDNRDGIVPDYCISPDIEMLSGSALHSCICTADLIWTHSHSRRMCTRPHWSWNSPAVHAVNPPQGD